MLRGGDQDLPPHVTALLLGGELVLEVDAGDSGVDEALGQLEDVESAAEARLAVGDDGHEPVDLGDALGPVDLVCPAKGVVDPFHQSRRRVGRVERLVGIHLTGEIAVPRHLPTRQIDRLQPRLDHLHRLTAAEGAECTHVVLRGEHLPEPDRHPVGQRGLLTNAPPKTHDVLGRVVPGDSFPTRVALP